MTTFNRSTRLLSCIIFLVICSSSYAGRSEEDVMAELERKYKEIELLIQTNATIAYGSISSPFGCFLLARNGRNVCAIRFTEFHRGHDAKPPSVFNSGDEALYAEYDWYYQGDGSGDFTKANVESGHEKLKRGSMVGIGRFSFQLGATAVKCGPFNLAWGYPNGIGFNLTYRKEDDVGNELAPTKWKEIFEVNSHDARLKWYRFDEKRKNTYIPKDEL